MSRAEFLKKFVAFNKKHRVPLPLIKAQLYVIFIVCFIHYGIVKGIRTLKKLICSPFIKLHTYFKANVKTIFQIECLVATIGICFLIIVQNGSVEVEENNTGALAGETYAAGDIKGTEAEVETIVGSDINKITTGNISNQESTGMLEGDAGEQVTESETSNNLTATLPYRIMVNRLANCVNIYMLDESNQYTVPYKAMICSTGGEKTPMGTFKISSKYEFKTLFYMSYGQYCSRIYGSILFHSSGNNSLNKNDLNAADFNQLGEGVSHGCIRLTVEDAKWIFDNCPSGTEVVVYEDENPGPLGKPEVIKVPLDTVWDPTDPDENNPWHKEQPRIEGVTDRVLYENDQVDYLTGIKAYDTCGNDITEEIIVEGKVDMDIPGDYVVTYTVTDLLGKTAEVSAIYTVK